MFGQVASFGVRRAVCSGRVCLGNYMQTGLAGDKTPGVLWDVRKGAPVQHYSEHKQGMNRFSF